MIGQRTQQLMVAGVVLFALVATGCGPEIKRLRDERDALFAQNQEAQNLIDDLRRANDALNNENTTLRSDLNSGGSSPGSQAGGLGNLGDGVTTRVDSNSITVNVPGDLLFASGKVTLTKASKAVLSQIASVIQSEHAGRRVRVEGYTDTDPIKKSAWKDNLELSLQRAAAVHRYLDEQGVASELMYAAGFGKNKAKSTKKLSRRVEIVVLFGAE